MQSTLEPFAMELYRRFLNGETVQQLSAELAIPPERISRRLEAAAAYRDRKEKTAPFHGFASGLTVSGPQEPAD